MTKLERAENLIKLVADWSIAPRLASLFARFVLLSLFYFIYYAVLFYLFSAILCFVRYVRAFFIGKWQRFLLDLMY